MANPSHHYDALLAPALDTWLESMREDLLKPNVFYEWGKPKEKPDPKLLEVNLTVEQVRALLENPDVGVLVHLDGYEVLIREA